MKTISDILATVRPSREVIAALMSESNKAREAGRIADACVLLDLAMWARRATA
jgi:hypothetical protein